MIKEKLLINLKMVVEYLNKLSREIYNKYGFNSPEYIEFKIFYNEVVDLIKYKSDNK